MAVDVDAGSFGTVLFSVLAGCRRVARRVFIAVWSCSLWLVLFPFGSFAIVAGVMDVVCGLPVGVVCFGD